MQPEYKAKVVKVFQEIRNKESDSTTHFLALYETLPKYVWEQAHAEGLISARELQSCMIVVKQYRKLQAKAAIENVEDK